MMTWLFFEQEQQMIPVSEIAGIFAKCYGDEPGKQDTLVFTKVTRYPRLDNGTNGMLIRPWHNKQVNIHVKNAPKALVAIAKEIDMDDGPVIYVEPRLREHDLLFGDDEEPSL